MSGDRRKEIAMQEKRVRNEFQDFKAFWDTDVRNDLTALKATIEQQKRDFAEERERFNANRK